MTIKKLLFLTNIILLTITFNNISAISFLNEVLNGAEYQVKKLIDKREHEVEKNIETIEHNRNLLGLIEKCSSEEIKEGWNSQSHYYYNNYDCDDDCGCLYGKKDLPNMAKTLEAKIVSLETRNKSLEEAKTSLDQMGLNIATDFIGIEKSKLKNQVQLEFNEKNSAIEQKKLIAEGLVKNKGAMERLKFLTESLTDPKTLKKIGITAGAILFGTIASYYGIKLTYEYLKKKMGKPKLVEETSIDSYGKRIKSFFKQTIAKPFSEKILGRKWNETTIVPTNEVILSQDIKEKAQTLSDDIKKLQDLKLPYQNLLLYGPPGTGKTAFAKALAQYSGMDYAILSGANFAQFKNGEAIVELFKLFNWAERSKKGVLIFFDEADACFRDRGTLNTDGVNFVNAFLSRTGASSDKFMLVFATNYEDTLDSAVRSRIHKKLNLPLPALQEREAIFNQKINKYIANDQRTYKQNGKKITSKLVIDNSVSADFIKEIAKKMEGFSGRDIEQAAAEMRIRSYQTENTSLTKDIVEKVIQNKIKEVEKDTKTNLRQFNKLQATAA